MRFSTRTAYVQEISSASFRRSGDQQCIEISSVQEISSASFTPGSWGWLRLPWLLRSYTADADLIEQGELVGVYAAPGSLGWLPGGACKHTIPITSTTLATLVCEANP
jgi:hypothetical protein